MPMPDATTKLTCARCAACAIVVATYAAGAGAQVYKCVDARGQVTYQQEACAGGASGGPVQLNDALKVRPAGDEALWSAAAREGKPLVGMPKPFVIAASGQPREIRAPRLGEGGTEVWVYAKGGR